MIAKLYIFKQEFDTRYVEDNADTIHILYKQNMNTSPQLFLFHQVATTNVFRCNSRDIILLLMASIVKCGGHGIGGF